MLCTSTGTTSGACQVRNHKGYVELKCNLIVYVNEKIQMVPSLLFNSNAEISAPHLDHPSLMINLEQLLTMLTMN